MAGEIEEPFSISFQADALHSGSISFGRFENEPLDWERRSSFSHNRYLEEVEKCLKPGSVIERTAYLEAHFKKKGLVSPGSSESPNCRDHQTSETDVLENEVLHINEYDNVKEGSHYDHLENVGYSEEYDYGNEESQSENVNEDIHYDHYDESPEGSQYHGECETTECEREDPGVSPTESHMESVLDNADVAVDSVPEDVNHEETHQTETGCEKLLLNDDEPVIEVNQNRNENVVNVDESFKHIDPSPKSDTAVEVDSTSSEHQSPKSRSATESEPTKPRFRYEVNVNKIQNNISHDALTTAAKTQNRRERESRAKMKKEKQSSQTAIPTRRSLHRTPRAEGSDGCDARLNRENKSEKEQRAKKVVESQSSMLKKVEPRARQDANRTKRTVNLTKPDARPSASTFSFKSDERAERRKEFYMKLEEKMHAKEAEMNQIQARTQEKKEAEIKQFRKSLNFKATPMPSFYHAAVPPGSDGNKAVSCNTKPAKSRHKSTSPGSRAAVRSPSLPKAGNDQAVSASESVKATDTTGTSDSGAMSSSPPTKNNRIPEAVRKNGIPGKKQLGKEKDSNLQKHRVSESGKVTKDQRVEGNLKEGARRNSNEMARKSMKGIDIGSSSGMGHVAVGVAS